MRVMTAYGKHQSIADIADHAAFAGRQKEFPG